MRYNLKYIVILLLSIFVLHSNAYSQDQYKITVKIKNTIDSVCYLGYPYGSKKYLLDTAKIRNGDTFTFSKVDTLEMGVYFIYTPNNIYFEIIGDSQDISLETDTVDLVNNLKITGSPQTQMFKDFQVFMGKSQLKAKSLSEKIKSDPDNSDKYKQELKDLDVEVKAYRSNLLDENSDLFISKLIRSTIDIPVPESPKDVEGKEIDPTWRYRYYKDHYFDNIDFSEPGMLRTPVFHQKIEEYLDKLTYKHPDSIIASAHIIIEKSMANQEVFRYCVVTLSNKYETSNIMGMDAVFVDIAENYYLTGEAYWADTTLVSKIEKRVQELKPLIGTIAPEFIVLDTINNPISMHAIESDFLILYFYAPDCGHCKKKTPELRNIYNEQLMELGVEVLAINTKSDMEEWKKFIRDLDLPWLNAADPNSQSNFRYQYYIDRTPKVFVLDKNKKIIAKRLDVDQLADFIMKQKELNQLN